MVPAIDKTELDGVFASHQGKISDLELPGSGWEEETTVPWKSNASTSGKLPHRNRQRLLHLVSMAVWGLSCCVVVLLFIDLSLLQNPKFQGEKYRILSILLGFILVLNTTVCTAGDLKKLVLSG